jgi:aerobic-type carbon monoxide dehydrogenase small subunit (CoxS/CutS family)
MALSPRVAQLTISFTMDDRTHAVTAWSDMTALEVVRAAVGRGGLPSRCEAGICGTCESRVDGIATRLCSVPGRVIDGTTITRPKSHEGE